MTFYPVWLFALCLFVSSCLHGMFPGDWKGFPAPLEAHPLTLPQTKEHPCSLDLYILKAGEAPSPAELIRKLIRQQKFYSLIQAIAKYLNNGITLEDLAAIADMESCKQLKNAIRAANAILRLQDISTIKMSHLLPITLYIETDLKTEIKKKKYWVSKKNTGLAFNIEYDRKSSSIFIHMRNNRLGHLGAGTHKTVLKSILYRRDDPEIVARCMMKSRANQQEVDVIKKFHGSPGLLEVKAIILRQKIDHEPQYDIFLKLYPGGTLSRFIQSNAFKSLTLNQKCRLALEIMTGLARIHDAGYAHRDLHLGNYFLYRKSDSSIPDPQFGIVIGDYGQMHKLRECAGLIPQPARNFQAPESLIYGGLRGPQYQSCDIYAIGCTLYILTYGHRPSWFEDSSKLPYPRKMPTSDLFHRQKKLVQKIMEEKAYTLTPIREKIARNEPLSTFEKMQVIIFSMVEPSYNKRPSANSIMKRLKILVQQSDG